MKNLKLVVFTVALLSGFEVSASEFQCSVLSVDTNSPVQAPMPMSGDSLRINFSTLEGLDKLEFRMGIEKIIYPLHGKLKLSESDIPYIKKYGFASTHGGVDECGMTITTKTTNFIFEQINLDQTYRAVLMQSFDKDDDCSARKIHFRDTIKMICRIKSQQEKNIILNEVTVTGMAELAWPRSIGLEESAISDALHKMRKFFGCTRFTPELCDGIKQISDWDIQETHIGGMVRAEATATFKKEGL